jgi:hypothetical protein
MPRRTLRVAQALHAASVREVAVVEHRHDAEQRVEQDLLSAQAAGGGRCMAGTAVSNNTGKPSAASSEALRRP